MSPASRYAATARSLHRLAAALIAVIVPHRVWNPAVIRLAAPVNHWGPYALLVLMPITGFLATRAWGSVSGVLPMPVPLGRNEETVRILSPLHWCGAIAIVLPIAAWPA